MNPHRHDLFLLRKSHNQRPRIAFTMAKLLAIPCSLCVLVFVLFSSYSGGSVIPALNRDLKRSGCHDSNQKKNSLRESCHDSNHEDNIREACQAAQYPELCMSMLQNAGVPKDASADQIIFASLDLSSKGTDTGYKQCRELLATSQNSNFTTYVGACLELLQASKRYLDKSRNVSFPGKIEDVQAWMSAALTFQTDCNNSLKYVTPSPKVTTTMNEIITLINMTSNVLSMVDALDIYGNEMSVWKPPVTERSKSFVKFSCNSAYGDWDPNDFHAELKPDVVVSKDDPSSLSIQEAINKAPDNSDQRFVIYVKQGVYQEIVKVPAGKNNILLFGDGMDKTIITGSLKVPSLPGNITTYGSATFAVNADGFIARNIAFENAAGPPTKQAVALRVDGDLAAFYNCAILGNQDSLYAHTLRQFYKNCRIEGNVDFIFGNAAAIFENCLILVRPRQENVTKTTSNPTTAQGRTDPAQTTGYVFNNCIINGTEKYMQDFHANPNLYKAFLGRPWKMYSRTIFMKSYLGEIMDPQGWLVWSGDFALETLYYGEYQNYGPGADVSKRVKWASVVADSNADIYSSKCFLQTN